VIKNTQKDKARILLIMKINYKLFIYRLELISYRKKFIELKESSFLIGNGSDVKDKAYKHAK
jgi:hypothetical protein